jgi:hypothetical protein
MTLESFILLMIFGSIAIISACTGEIQQNPPEKKNTTKKEEKEDFVEEFVEKFEEVSEEDYSLPSYSEVTRV